MSKKAAVAVASRHPAPQLTTYNPQLKTQRHENK